MRSRMGWSVMFQKLFRHIATATSAGLGIQVEGVTGPIKHLLSTLFICGGQGVSHINLHRVAVQLHQLAPGRSLAFAHEFGN